VSEKTFGNRYKTGLKNSQLFNRETSYGRKEFTQKNRVASLLGNPAVSAIQETRGFPSPTGVEFGL
jgi:hypothetical protein